MLVVCGLWPVGAPLVWLATSPTQVRLGLGSGLGLGLGLGLKLGLGLPTYVKLRRRTARAKGGPNPEPNPNQVWQHLTLTYALLTAAMALLAGCSNWRRYVHGMYIVCALLCSDWRR